MTLSTKTFQYIVFAFFGVFFVIAILLFSVSGNRGKNGAGGVGGGGITIWGTLDAQVINAQLAVLSEANNQLSLTYVEKEPEVYDQELLEALASGSGPDLFFLSNDKVVEHANKIFEIPYASYPLELFSQQYIDEADVFLTPTGVLAFPFTVDPMVMYFNRDLLNAEFIINPPTYWDELLPLSEQLSQQTESGQILRSTVAFGTHNNITHVKDMLAILSMQGGNMLVGRDLEGGLVSTLGNSNNGQNAMASGLRFYVGFANPAQDAYSWNIGLPNDREAFVANDLVFYFGYASELQEIRAINPNLNFEVALMPQIRNSNTKITHGNVNGIAVSKVSPNRNQAFAVANALTSQDYAKRISDSLLLPPVHRASLLNRPTDPFFALFYDSALISRTWLDPDPEATDQIFGTMITNTNSGLLQAGEAVNQARIAIDRLLAS